MTPIRNAPNAMKLQKDAARPLDSQKSELRERGVIILGDRCSIWNFGVIIVILIFIINSIVAFLLAVMPLAG